MTRPLRSDTSPTGPGSSAGTPRWVKVAAGVVLVLALLVGALLLLGGGAHGPARHAPSGQGSGQQVPVGHVDVDVDVDLEDAGGHSAPAGAHG